MKIGNLSSFILGFILLTTFNAQAQYDDKAIAEYHYNQGDFASAKLYYEKIIKTDGSVETFQHYMTCLTVLKEWEAAENLAQKRTKQFPDGGIAFIQLGLLYQQMNQPEDAEKQFNKAIQELNPSRPFVIRMAQEFNNQKLPQFALLAYEKGKKKGKEGYAYDFEIATTKGSMGDMNGMYDSFLNLLGLESQYLVTIETTLSRLINFEDHPEQGEALKQVIIKRVQSEPDKKSYMELLIWYFTQIKNFDQAYYYSTSTDKKFKEDGYRVYELGNFALNSQDFIQASRCFDYVSSKGESGPYYYSSKMSSLDSRYQALCYNQMTEQAALEKLALDIYGTLQEVPRTDDAVALVEEWVDVNAFRLQKMDSTELVLRAILEEWKGLTPRGKAKLKTLLGDLLVLEDNIWEASLFYSQVELDFKEDPIGNLAKYKNAKVFFYSGDYGWAQSQLEALKASTSKLIANDAIDLSVMIMESVQDSNELPLYQYAQADRWTLQHQYALALACLDTILTDFPGHPLQDEALYLKAQIFRDQHQDELALSAYKQIVDFHFTELKYDDALFQLGVMEATVFNRKEEAMKWFDKLFTEVPGSLYQADARKQYRILRGDTLE